MQKSGFQKSITRAVSPENGESMGSDNRTTLFFDNDDVRGLLSWVQAKQLREPDTAKMHFKILRSPWRIG